MIIGIAGESEHGKDEIGKIIDELWLEKNYKGSEWNGKIKPVFYDEFRLIKFTSPVNLVIQAITGLPIDYIMNKDNYNIPIQWLGGKTLRDLKQIIGEGMKPLLGNDIWVKSSFSKVSAHANVKITDVRYHIELDFLVNQKAILIFVERPGHVSESMLESNRAHQAEAQIKELDKSKFHHHIINDGSRAQLKERVAIALDTHEEWKNSTSLRESF